MEQSKAGELASRSDEMVRLATKCGQGSSDELSHIDWEKSQE